MIKIDLQSRIAGGRLSLSNAYIKSVAEKLLADFSPETLKTPQPTDVDAFITDYLGFDLRYEWLSHNGWILGMTNYFETTIICYDKENHDTVRVYVGDNTVLIDNRVGEGENRVRYAYTAGHECGHIIFDNPIIWEQKEKSRRLAMENYSFEAGEEFHVIQRRQTAAAKDEAKWTEHYAEYFSSCLILPDATVKMVALDLLRKHGIRSDCIHSHNADEERFCLDVLAGGVASLYDTSKSAALYKLCDLKIVRGGGDIIQNMKKKYKIGPM